MEQQNGKGKGKGHHPVTRLPGIRNKRKPKAMWVDQTVRTPPDIAESCNVERKNDRRCLTRKMTSEPIKKWIPRCRLACRCCDVR